MNIKNKIITKELLYAIMLLFMTVWACGAWAQNETSQEKLLYSTDFTDWDDIDRKVAATYGREYKANLKAIIKSPSSPNETLIKEAFATCP